MTILWHGWMMHCLKPQPRFEPEKRPEESLDLGRVGRIWLSILFIMMFLGLVGLKFYCDEAEIKRLKSEAIKRGYAHYNVQVNEDGVATVKFEWREKDVSGR